MFQNRSSSTESAHANTEAGVSGHCFDSSGKSIEWEEVVKITIHSFFRTEDRPRHQQTLIPKLALVDTVYTAAARA